MKRNLLNIIIALVLLSGCNPEKSPEEKKISLEEQVLAVHDSAMAKMGDIYKMRKNLRTLRDTLEATTQADTVTVNKLQAQIYLLNQADEAMMGWMRQYKTPAEDMPDEQAINYLQQELVKIERVQTLMDSTINAARTTYNVYDQNK